MAGPPRTRIGAERRRAQILAAAHRVTLERGLHDLRVADVAADLGVSTGLIHYHFATRDELLGAMLRETAAREIDGVRRRLDRLDGPAERLDAAIEAYLPSVRRDPSWVLWIDAWGEALRDPTVRRISEELDGSWIELFEQVIAAGVRAGVFRADDPTAAAWRLCSLLDGLGLQVVLHKSTMSRAQMGRHVRLVASRELGYEPGIAPR